MDRRCEGGGTRGWPDVPRDDAACEEEKEEEEGTTEVEAGEIVRAILVGLSETAEPRAGRFLSMEVVMLGVLDELAVLDARDGTVGCGPSKERLEGGLLGGVALLLAGTTKPGRPVTLDLVGAGSPRRAKQSGGGRLGSWERGQGERMQSRSGHRLVLNKERVVNMVRLARQASTVEGSSGEQMMREA